LDRAAWIAGGEKEWPPGSTGVAIALEVDDFEGCVAKLRSSGVKFVHSQAQAALIAALVFVASAAFRITDENGSLQECCGRRGRLILFSGNDQLYLRPHPQAWGQLPKGAIIERRLFGAANE